MESSKPVNNEGFVGGEVFLKDEERTRCEIWTRVMGYFRPKSSFNRGKCSECSERRCFTENKYNSHAK